VSLANNVVRCLVSAFLLNLSLPGIGSSQQGTPPAPVDTVPVVESGVLAEGVALNERRQQEKQAQQSRFSILPHKPNYLLPLSYNAKPNNYPDGGVIAPNENLDPVEVKFQLSIKTPIWEDIIDNNGTLYLAYSQLAFWQAYNSGASAPFREINFEPEAFVAFNTGYELLGVTSQMVTIGVNHQSNGRTQPMSRSWNRITANLLFSKGETYVNLRPWYRIPENMLVDDNPHMEKYYGYGELYIMQKIKSHTVTLMLRNNLRGSGNRGAVQADWSFPLHKQIKGYVQYFNGYGESLLDYNHANNRIGVGVMLSDWL
jgi:phospholipase A1